MRKAICNMQKVQIAIGGVFLTIFLVTVVYQMLARQLGIAQMWTADISKYSFIWSVFMGGAAMVYENKHFAFTSLKDKLQNEKIKSIIQLVICVVMLFFSVLMIFYGISVAKQFWNYTWEYIPSFKRGPVWLCIPICGVTSTIYLIDEMINEVLSLLGKKSLGGDK